MIEPYKMVVVNIILLLTLVSFCLIYRFIFPRKKIPYLILLIIISLLPLVSILRKGTYESGDMSLQATGTLSFFNSLIDGNLIPRWGAEYFHGLGSPHHEIMYFLSRYIIAIIHLFGFSILNSIKVYLALSFVISGVAMYYWIKDQWGERAGFVAGIFYLFAPYHLVDMHFRVEIGEMASFAILPLVFLSVKRAVQTKSLRWILAEAVSIALLILSHQAIAILFFPFIIMYHFILYLRTKKKTLKDILFPIFTIFIGILLTSFYWMPILVEGARYTWVSHVTAIQSTVEFHNFWEYIYSSWRYGLLFQGPSGQLSFVVGYTHWFVILISLYLLVRKRLNSTARDVSLLCLAGFAVLFFMMQSISNIVWQTIPLIKYSQNSYRLLLLLAFFSATLAGISITQIKRNSIVVLICLLTVALTILNWGNRGVIPTISDDLYFQRNTYLYMTENNGYDFSLPIWADPKKTPIWNRPLTPIEIVSGIGNVKTISRTTTRHTYTVNAKTDLLIRENTLYFPGWKVQSDKKDIEINYTREDFPGIIFFNLPPGNHRVEVFFADSDIRSIADRVSSITTILVLLLLLLSEKGNKYKYLSFLPKL